MIVFFLIGFIFMIFIRFVLVKYFKKNIVLINVDVYVGKLVIVIKEILFMFCG